MPSCPSPMADLPRLIPSAGPGKAIIMLFVIVQAFDFAGGNYLFVLFLSNNGSRTIGDSSQCLIGYTPSIWCGTLKWWMDSLPKQGKASYALSSAITVSTAKWFIVRCFRYCNYSFYSTISAYVGIPKYLGLC